MRTLCDPITNLLICDIKKLSSILVLPILHKPVTYM